MVYPADSVANPEVTKVIFSSVAPAFAFAARWHSAATSIVKTTDAGASWNAIASPDPHVWALEIDQRKGMCPNGSPLHFWTGLFTQYAPDTTKGGMIEETTDGGVSWHTTGFPKVQHPPSVWVIKFDSTSGTLAAATDSGIFIGHAPARGVAQNIRSQASMNLFPNPASRSTTLTLPAETSDRTPLHLYSVLGKLVAAQKLSNGKNFIDLASLPPGVYFARIIGISDVRTSSMIVLPH